MYEYIVIGGGTSGLYFAMHHPNSLVLEREHTLGGRTQSMPFGQYDVQIKPGAGIGVASRDHLLIKLMKDLNFSYSTFWMNVSSAPCLDILKKLYDNANSITAEMTFLDYMKITLTPEEMRTFQRDNGYTDYQQANAIITMMYYGLEDNCSKYIALSILWSKLVNEMSKYCNFKTSHDVLKLRGSYPEFEVVTDQGSYYCQNVVIATTISTVQKLLDYPIYSQVIAHPFMRIYASFDESNTKIMHKFFPDIVVTHNKLHFVIHMKDNVWMLAYTDGDDAVSLHQKVNTAVIEAYLHRMTKHKISILDMKVFFWKEGSHYYAPGEIDFIKLRNPEQGIYVVGEAVAKRQGWCNGGLESVEEVLTMIGKN